MKLKTLKDFEIKGKWEKELSPFVKREELKAEAIKWVKDCSGNMPWDKRNDLEWGQCAGCEWFIKFFNLTEEDLE